MENMHHNEMEGYFRLIHNLGMQKKLAVIAKLYESMLKKKVKKTSCFLIALENGKAQKAPSK